MAKNLSSIFKNVILMSGTPDYKQIDITNKHPENECFCSPKTAMENGWICKPNLNLIECDEQSWPSAVKNVLEREMKIYDEEKIFKPTILVNCSSIDDIDHLRNIDWFKDNTGKNFHFISIHSSKKIKDKDELTARDVTAEIDGKSVSSGEAYEAVESIDSNKLFNDDLPVIVAQVQMIGEGINVSSFNAVITASSSDKTVMQQIGRAIRNFKISKMMTKIDYEDVDVVKPKNGFFNKLLKRTEVVKERREVKTEYEANFDKVHNGHANVYVINDNLDDVVQLICNLDQYDLTEHCYTWGKRIDCTNGSALVEGMPKDYCECIKNEWLDINESDPDIVQIIGNARKFILSRANKNWLVNNEDNDGNGIPDLIELGQLVNSDAKKNFKETYVGKGKKTDAEIFNILMNTIAGALGDPWHKMLWQKSKLAYLTMIFNGDNEVSNFFMTHLNKRQFAQLNAI